MALTLDEQEVIISYSRSDELATLYTSDPTMIRKIKKILNESNENGEFVVKREDEDSIEVVFPKRCIKISPKKKREISEEERQRRIQTIADARERKKKTKD